MQHICPPVPMLQELLNVLQTASTHNSNVLPQPQFSYLEILIIVDFSLFYLFFYQHVKCRTRNTRVLDKCYGNITFAYQAKALPSLANSDHSTVFLMPTYKTTLKSNKPQPKTVLQWTEYSVKTHKGCFFYAQIASFTT